MSATLVAYFSATGTTRRVATRLAHAISADLFEIVPEVPYSRSDLNWHDRRSRTSLEKADDAARPAIAGALPDMGAYDTVFVGFPIWWYVEPRIIDTFLESADLKGKVVVPFATSGGSGLGQAPDRMRRLSGATVRGGKVLSSGMGEEQLRAWARSV